MLPAVAPRPVRLSEPMLYAALRGSAEVTVGGDVRTTLPAGSGIWVPAGGLVAVRPAPGAIVLPVPAAGPGRTTPTLVAVPEHAHHGLLHALANALGHLDGMRRPSGLELRGAAPEPLAPPPAPSSAELRALAALLTEEPDTGIPAAVVAAAPGWGLRTVQRRFHTETGWTLAAWARRQRMRIGAELISDGRDLLWVANRVGYQSLPGFIRAFAEATGSTPGQWRDGSAAACMRQDSAELGWLAGEGGGQGEGLDGGASGGAGGASGEAGGASGGRRSGAGRTWSRVNGAHVAVWSAIGEAEVVVGGRTLTLREGEAVVVPAGIPNECRVPAGTLLLPLGYCSALTGPIGAPLRPAQLGGLKDVAGLDGGAVLEGGAMLEAVLATYTTIGVVGVDPDRGFAATLAGSEREPVSLESELLGIAANRFVREPELSLAAAAERLGRSERELCAAVASCTGLQFTAWLRLLRMTRARNQLGDGERPAEISRELGYAHLPAFSRAFRAVHGAGPTVLGVPNLRPTRAAWGREMRVPATAL